MSTAGKPQKTQTTEQLRTKILSAPKVLFIKLGRGGKWEEDCLTRDNTLHIGFREFDHDFCSSGKWSLVKSEYVKNEVKKPSKKTATSYVNQLKLFYESLDDTIWLTFYNNKLWWCFAEKTITRLEDKTKTRPVIGKWSDQDIRGKTLNTSCISGKLLKTQGFQGTICKVDAKDYARYKISGIEQPAVSAARKAKSQLVADLAVAIQSLCWHDFELLCDLIFRQGGWQRVSAVGKTQKTIDLDLIAPVSGERALVQIKSRSDLKQFESYAAAFSKMTDYDKSFFIVHSPDSNLRSCSNESDIQLWFVEQVATMAINAGLVDWVIEKAG